MSLDAFHPYFFLSTYGRISLVIRTYVHAYTRVVYVRERERERERVFRVGLSLSCGALPYRPPEEARVSDPGIIRQSFVV